MAKPQELIFKHPLKQETVSLTSHALRIQVSHLRAIQVSNPGDQSRLAIQVIHLRARAIASTTAGINMNVAVPIAIVHICHNHHNRWLCKKISQV